MGSSVLCDEKQAPLTGPAKQVLANITPIADLPARRTHFQSDFFCTKNPSWVSLLKYVILIDLPPASFLSEKFHRKLLIFALKAVCKNINPFECKRAEESMENYWERGDIKKIQWVWWSGDGEEDFSFLYACHHSSSKKHLILLNIF